MLGSLFSGVGGLELGLEFKGFPPDWTDIGGPLSAARSRARGSRTARSRADKNIGEGA